MFHSLGKPELLRIVDLEVDKVLTRIKAKEVHIDLQQSAKEFLIDKGYDPQYGARPMRRAVERFLEDPLAEELLRGNVKPGDHVDVVAADGKLSFKVPGITGTKQRTGGAGAELSHTSQLRPRMRIRVRFLETFDGDVRVDLCRGKTRVPE